MQLSIHSTEANGAKRKTQLLHVFQSGLPAGRRGKQHRDRSRASVLACRSKHRTRIRRQARRVGLQAAASVSASTMPSTTSSTSTLSSPSPMTRITGSVPDGRTIRRPWPLRRCLGVLDGGADLGVLERLAALVAHVLHHLRQRLEAVADLRHRLVLLLHHGQHLQRGEQAVAGRGVVGQDDVARRLAADIVAVLAHVLEHVAVADRRAHERDAEPAR